MSRLSGVFSPEAETEEVEEANEENRLLGLQLDGITIECVRK